MSDRSVLYSYTIFNTLITLLSNSIQGIYSVVEKELCGSSCFKDIDREFLENFLDFRIYCEALVRESNNSVTITDIYNYISRVFGLNEAQRDKVLRLEIETINNYMVPVTENLSKLKTTLGKGKKIILISRGYYPLNNLKNFIKNVSPGLIEQCDIIDSSLIGDTHPEINVFDFILQKYTISPDQLVHAGSDYYLDFIVPRQKGIKTVYFDHFHKNSFYFKKGFEANVRKNINVQISLGISRYTQLHLSSTLSTLSATIAAPWLIGFSEWILHNVDMDRLNTKKIFFLARDGDLILNISKKIKREDFPFALTYLDISRQSVVFSTAGISYDFFLDYVFHGNPGVNLTMIAERSLIEKDYLKTYLRRKYGVLLTNKWLTVKQRIQVRTIFEKDATLKSTIQHKSSLQKGLLIEYLEQQGVFDSPDFVIADLGWHCTIQDALYLILQEKQMKIHGYYFGISQYSKYTDKNNRKKAFLFYPFTTDSSCPKSAFRIFTELFCASGDDMTMAFEKKDSMVIPVKNKNDLGNEWIDEIRKGIFAYLSVYKKYQPFTTISFKDIASFLMKILLMPEKEIVEILGDLPYSADPFDTQREILAPPYTKLKHILHPHKYTRWYRGSLKRSSFLFRSLLWIMNLYKKKGGIPGKVKYSHPV